MEKEAHVACRQAAAEVWCVEEAIFARLCGAWQEGSALYHVVVCGFYCAGAEEAEAAQLIEVGLRHVDHGGLLCFVVLFHRLSFWLSFCSALWRK